MGMMPSRFRYSTRYYSTKQEKAVSKAVSGKRTPNSGAAKFVGGDVTTDKFLLECKTATTAKQSFTIKKAWLEKNEDERFAMGKDYSALVFDFGDNGKRYYVIDEQLFVRLTELLEDENGM